VEHPPVRAERLPVLAAARPDVLLVADVERGAEFGDQVPHVRPGQGEHPARAPGAARPDALVQLVQVLRRSGRMVGGQYVAMAWPGRVRDTAHDFLAYRRFGAA